MGRLTVVFIEVKLRSLEKACELRDLVSPVCGSWITQLFTLCDFNVCKVTSIIDNQAGGIPPLPCPEPLISPGPPYFLDDKVPPAQTLKRVWLRWLESNFARIFGTPSQKFESTIKFRLQQSKAALQSVSNDAKGVDVWWEMSSAIRWHKTAWSVFLLPRNPFGLSARRLPPGWFSMECVTCLENLSLREKFKLHSNKRMILV